MTGDRVRANTAAHINERIDRCIEDNVRFYSTQTRERLNERIDELDREWDIERILITQASSLAMTGMVLGALHSRKWFALSGLVLPMLLLHGVQGWCPPVPLLRRLGVRTRGEIDCEKFAIKALRGDFETIPEPAVEEADKMPRAEQALEAAMA